MNPVGSLAVHGAPIADLAAELFYGRLFTLDPSLRKMFRGDMMVLLVLHQGLRLAVVGVIIGIPAAIAGSRLLTSLLFGVSATDPAVLASIALLVTAVALAACWIPAWRATQVATTEALRAE